MGICSMPLIACRTRHPCSELGFLFVCICVRVCVCREMCVCLRVQHGCLGVSPLCCLHRGLRRIALRAPPSFTGGGSGAQSLVNAHCSFTSAANVADTQNIFHQNWSKKAQWILGTDMEAGGSETKPGILGSHAFMTIVHDDHETQHCAFVGAVGQRHSQNQA